MSSVCYKISPEPFQKAFQICQEEFSRREKRKAFRSLVCWALQKIVDAKIGKGKREGGKDREEVITKFGAEINDFLSAFSLFPLLWPRKKSSPIRFAR